MILFAVCALLGLIVYVVSDFTTVFICWRSGTFFFVMPKYLAIVVSQWVQNISFDFGIYVSYFCFGRRFWSVKIKNIRGLLGLFVYHQ